MELNHGKPMKGSDISLPIITFEKGKFELSVDQKSLLLGISEIMLHPKFQNKTYEIQGFADTTGMSKGFDNEKLSYQRVGAIKDFLIKKCNVPTDKLMKTVANVVEEVKRQTEIVIYDTVFTLAERTLIEDDISLELQEKLKSAGFTINTGNEPPNIAGTFVNLEPMCFYDSDEGDAIGGNWAATKYTFKRTKNVYNVIDYSNGNKYRYQKIKWVKKSSSNNIKVFGNEDGYFTAYYIAESTHTSEYSKNKTKVKTAVLISGRMTTYGIEKFRDCFVVLKKGFDLYSEWMSIGSMRIFSNEDEVAWKE